MFRSSQPLVVQHNLKYQTSRRDKARIRADCSLILIICTSYNTSEVAEKMATAKYVTCKLPYVKYPKRGVREFAKVKEKNALSDMVALEVSNFMNECESRLYTH